MLLDIKLKEELWWLLIAADYELGRITIAEHDIDNEKITLWLEDKYDLKGTLDECLKVEIKLADFGKFIRQENMNSYVSTKVHPGKGFIYRTRVEINKPIKWYRKDASAYEQQYVREELLKSLLTSLIEGEVLQTH